jgi:5'-deoxynucleotidase YfbR-like HD superfamily hydrolase
MAESQYGQDLLERSRFGDFKPDWVSTELWGGLLGPDVNNLYHMHHTAENADRFAYEEELNPLSTKLLTVTAAVHDLGEAVIGDIALPSKTREDEKREEVAFRHIANELWGVQVGQRLSKAVWSVLNKTDKKHGDMFRAIEYVGYCTTAMQAGRMATNIAHGFQTINAPRTDKEQLLGGLLGLEKAVSVHNYPVLSQYVKVYPGIERML